jgi:hypothetical protein
MYVLTFNMNLLPNNWYGLLVSDHEYTYILFTMSWFLLSQFMIFSNKNKVKDCSQPHYLLIILWHIRFSLVTWSMHHIAFP